MNEKLMQKIKDNQRFNEFHGILLVTLIFGQYVTCIFAVSWDKLIHENLQNSLMDLGGGAAPYLEDFLS